MQVDRSNESCQISCPSSPPGRASRCYCRWRGQDKRLNFWSFHSASCQKEQGETGKYHIKDLYGETRQQRPVINYYTKIWSLDPILHVPLVLQRQFECWTWFLRVWFDGTCTRQLFLRYLSIVACMRTHSLDCRNAKPIQNPVPGNEQ